MNTTPWLVWLVPCAFIWGCATGPMPRAKPTEVYSLTIEVLNADGSLQWRQTIISEAGTQAPPGANERIRK